MPNPHQVYMIEQTMKPVTTPKYYPYARPENPLRKRTRNSTMKSKQNLRKKPQPSNNQKHSLAIKPRQAFSQKRTMSAASTRMCFDEMYFMIIASRIYFTF